MNINAETEIDTAGFQKKLIREAFMLSLIFSLAKVDAIKTPVLVITAEMDTIFAPDEQEATARIFGAKSIVIKGQAHNLMMESGWK